MNYPVWTATYAGALAILYVVLSAWVIRGRFKFKVLHGDGGDRSMLRRMRAHGNFAEYVPLCLLILALLEMRGASATTMHALLLPLLLARAAHPFGMEAAPGSAMQYALRGLLVIVTLAVLGMGGLLLLLGR